jgi:hypothetical protein
MRNCYPERWQIPVPKAAKQSAVAWQSVCATGLGSFGGTNTKENAMAPQADWRFCQKCQAMYFDGFPQKGVCAAGDTHQAAGFNFVLPHDLPSALDFDFNPIVFDNGVPVGGFSHLTIRQDGSYTFSGHFHDSGADEFNMSLVWAVKDSQNLVYTVQHVGHVAGTFESGPRDDDWQVDSIDGRIADNWAFLGTGSFGTPTANANADLVNVINSLIGTVGTVVGVIALA